MMMNDDMWMVVQSPAGKSILAKWYILEYPSISKFCQNNPT